MNESKDDKTNKWSKIPTNLIQEYTKYYYKDKSGNKQWVHQHRNGLFVVGLSKEHPVIGKKIKVIDFKVTLKNGTVLDRLNNVAVGKRKRGTQRLWKDSVLCKIILEDDTVYNIESGVSGELFFMNSKLQDVAKRNCIHTSPEYDGFIAYVRSGEKRNKRKKIDVEQDWKHLVKY